MRPLAWLDPWVLRRPFVGRTAARYASQRLGFGDFDARLCARMAPDLEQAKLVLDLGAGAGELTRRLRRVQPNAAVVALEPSADYAAPGGLRARGEALPLANGCVDVAVCLSSIRHVADRLAVFTELRRVVRLGGAVYIAELDPDADQARRAHHRRGIRTAVASALFEWVVLPTCPSAAEIEQVARMAGWEAAGSEPDASQPFYVMRLS